MADCDAKIPNDPFDSELICLVDVLLQPQTAYEADKRRAKLPRDDLRSRSLAPEILELLGFACREQLAKYPTTVDEDLRRLEDQKRLDHEIQGLKKLAKASNNKVQLHEASLELLRIGRYCHALEVRIGEKTVLENARLYAGNIRSVIINERAKKRAAEDPASRSGSKKSRTG